MADYGFDLSGIEDITPGMVAVAGRLVLVQALCRRLMTRRGTLFYAPQYGFDLRDLLNAAIVNTNETAFQIEQELLKDDRVFEVRAQVRQVGMNELRVKIDVTDDAGPFDFVISVNDVKITLLRQ